MIIEHGHRLPRRPGQGRRAVVAHVRPDGPPGPDDDVQRHARNDRRRPEVPRLQHQLDERGRARRGGSAPPRAGRRTWPSSTTSSTRSAWPRGNSCSSTPGAATSSRSAKRTRTSASSSPRKGRSSPATIWSSRAAAREIALAHAFINFLHDPAVAAENTDFIYYLCPNKDSYPLLPAEIRDNPGIFMAPEIRAKSEMIADIGASQRPLHQGLGPPQGRPLRARQKLNA